MRITCTHIYHTLQYENIHVHGVQFGTVKLIELNIGKFCYFNYNYISYH